MFIDGAGDKGSIPLMELKWLKTFPSSLTVEPLPSLNNMQPLKIPMKPVRSSNIDAIGHDKESKTLAIRFKGGQTYHYRDVPHEVYMQVISADSIGRAVGKWVVKSGYKYTKL